MGSLLVAANAETFRRVLPGQGDLSVAGLRHLRHCLIAVQPLICMFALGHRSTNKNAAQVIAARRTLLQH